MEGDLQAQEREYGRSVWMSGGKGLKGIHGRGVVLAVVVACVVEVVVVEGVVVMTVWRMSLLMAGAVARRPRTGLLFSRVLWVIAVRTSAKAETLGLISRKRRTTFRSSW